jgi:hypothetical protein
VEGADNRGSSLLDDGSALVWVRVLIDLLAGPGFGPLVARVRGLAWLLPCRRRRAATRRDGIHSDSRGLHLPRSSPVYLHSG